MSLVFESPAEGRAALVRKGQYVVLRVSGSSRYINRDYAPSHPLSDSDPEMRAANAVFNWLVKEKPAGEDLDLATQYLQQWSDGPQAGDAEAAAAAAITAAAALPPDNGPIAEPSTASELFDVMNRLVWELGDHETDSERALQIRSQIHSSLSQLRAAWRRRDRSGK